jgi:hypothetical protein
VILNATAPSLPQRWRIFKKEKKEQKEKKKLISSFRDCKFSDDPFRGLVPYLAATLVENSLWLTRMILFLHFRIFFGA